MCDACVVAVELFVPLGLDRGVTLHAIVSMGDDEIRDDHPFMVYAYRTEGSSDTPSKGDSDAVLQSLLPLTFLRLSISPKPVLAQTQTQT